MQGIDIIESSMGFDEEDAVQVNGADGQNTTAYHPKM